MGDRTDLHVTVPLSQEQRWRDFFHETHGIQPDDEGEVSIEDGFVEFYYSEVNYAASAEIEKAADMGIIFRGRHGAGGNYCSAAFVSHEGLSWIGYLDHVGEVWPVAFKEDGTMRLELPPLPNWSEYGSRLAAAKRREAVDAKTFGANKKEATDAEAT